EQCGRLKGLKVAYVGDGNNVARSLAMACVRFEMEFAIAAPKGYTLGDDFISGLQTQGKVSCTSDPKEAVRDADVIYTDTWISMGQEDEKQQRLEVFADYQVNSALMAAAGKDVKVMHCLPAYRGCEITDEAIESSQSIVFEQAENRLH
ncbi:unnamed protein product, partial [marine sediment metagenome]